MSKNNGKRKRREPATRKVESDNLLSATKVQNKESGTLLPKCYTVKDLALEWRLSTDAIRRRFADEPDVIVIANSKPEKRPYRTLRIPQSVIDRVRNK
jgi:hypothetical protein